MEELLQQLLAKIDSLNNTLQDILKVTKSDNHSIISTILGIENKIGELKDAAVGKRDKRDGDIVIINDEESFVPDIQSVQQQATRIRRNIISVWKKSLNERKLAYWNHLKCTKTVNTYNEWLQLENPVLPRKFRPRTISGEHEDDKKIRRDMAVKAFQAEIKILTNKAERYRTSYETVDSEMSTIFEKRSNEEGTCEKLEVMWKKECQNEEERSIAIWAKKQEWLNNYQERFGFELFLNDVNREEPSQHRNRGQFARAPQTNRNQDARNTATRQTGIHTNHVQSRPNQNINRTRTNFGPDNRRQTYSNYRNKESNNRPGETYNRQRPTYRSNSRPIQRDGTTYIGRNVRTSFLEKIPYDKDGGSHQTEETRPKTIQ